MSGVRRLSLFVFCIVALTGCEGSADHTVGLTLIGDDIHLVVCRDDRVTALKLYQVHGQIAADPEASAVSERDELLWAITSAEGSLAGDFALGTTPQDFREVEPLHRFSTDEQLYLDIETDDGVSQGVHFRPSELSAARILNGAGESLTPNEFREDPANDDC